jgi:hypothetical protein
MILALRKRHRPTFLALGIFLPMAFVIGIATRPPSPVLSALPSALAAIPPAFTELQWDRNDLFAKASIQARLLREHAGSGRYQIALSYSHEFAKPDVLVYWADGKVDSAVAQLPANARLLGECNLESALLLPDHATSGSLILYSLANHEIVDVSKPLAFQ